MHDNSGRGDVKRRRGGTLPDMAAGSRVSFALTCAVAALMGGATGCTSDEWPPVEPEQEADSEGGSGGEGAGDALQDATLRVFEPESASIHLIGEPVPLIAQVTDRDGFPVAYDAVAWTSDQQEAPLSSTAEGEVELDPGIHEITARVSLPDGDRLETRVGGVRVQSYITGQWAAEATMAMAVEFQGLALAPTCTTPFDFSVGMDGKSIEIGGDGLCTLDLVLLQIPVAFTMNPNPPDAGLITGTITYDFVGFIAVDMAITGKLDGDGLFATFDGEVGIPLLFTAPINGLLIGNRVTPYLPEDDDSMD